MNGLTIVVIEEQCSFKQVQGFKKYLHTVVTACFVSKNTIWD